MVQAGVEFSGAPAVPVTVEFDEAGVAHVKVLLTISGCPLSGTISDDVRRALGGV